MPERGEPSISIRLEPARVRELARAAALEPHLSRSLLRGFAMLAQLARDERPRGLIELARELGMSPSTAHRYAQTLLELGAIERCPRTRRYRLTAGAGAREHTHRGSIDRPAALSRRPGSAG